VDAATFCDALAAYRDTRDRVPLLHLLEENFGCPEVFGLSFGSPVPPASDNARDEWLLQVDFEGLSSALSEAGGPLNMLQRTSMWPQSLLPFYS